MSQNSGRLSAGPFKALTLEKVQWVFAGTSQLWEIIETSFATVFPISGAMQRKVLSERSGKFPARKSALNSSLIGGNYADRRSAWINVTLSKASRKSPRGRRAEARAGSQHNVKRGHSPEHVAGREKWDPERLARLILRKKMSNSLRELKRRAATNHEIHHKKLNIFIDSTENSFLLKLDGILRLLGC